MTECMNSYDGTVRHDEYTEAEYEVHRTESFSASWWCASCLLEYIEGGMADCLVSVRRIRPVETQEEKDQHAQVTRALDPHDIEM